MKTKYLWDIIHTLRAEVERLISIITDNGAKLNKMDADNKRLNNSCDVGYMEILHRSNDKLKAEIKQLKADAKHDADVCYDVDDKNHEWINELKADNKRLNDDNKKRLNEIIELQSDNKRLVEQVNSNRGSNSTSHKHTLGSVNCSISREIAEYMENNDKCKDARLFIVPIEEFDEDECCNKWLTWDEGIE